MQYTLHQLRVFQQVVECKSVTKASVQLNMTQPAVSIQLKNFQNQFEIPLTEVLGRQLYVTDFGKEIYEIACSILNEVKRMEYKTNAFKGILSGKLKVSSVSTGKYVLPSVLSDFLAQHPGVELDMDVTNKREVVQSLEQNEVDFSLVSIKPSKLSLKSCSLMQNHLFLVGNTAHPLMQSKKKGKRFLKELPLIYREEGSGTRFLMQQYFEEKNITPKIRLQLKSNEAVKQAVLAGLGFSVLSLVSLKDVLPNGHIRIIPAKGLPLHSEWQFVWLEKKKLSPIAQAFIDYVDQNREQIYEQKFQWMEPYINE